MKLISGWVVSIDINPSEQKKLLVTLRDNYYMSFFTQCDSDPSVAQKRKYAAMKNLGAESDFAVLDSNSPWLWVLSTLQIISNKSFG